MKLLVNRVSIKGFNLDKYNQNTENQIFALGLRVLSSRPIDTGLPRNREPFVLFRVQHFSFLIRDF